MTGPEQAALWIGMKDAEAGHGVPDEPRRGGVLGLRWLIRLLVARPAQMLADPHLESLRRLGLRLAGASGGRSRDVDWTDFLARAQAELPLLSPYSQDLGPKPRR